MDFSIDDELIFVSSFVEEDVSVSLLENRFNSLFSDLSVVIWSSWYRKFPTHKTKGLFFSTRNSSALDFFFNVNASFAVPHEIKKNDKQNTKIKFLMIFFLNLKILKILTNKLLDL